jgi:hypothetical protein
MIGVLRPELEDWAVTRRRMLRETEAFIEDALVHPEHWIAIPTIRVGEGDFVPGHAALFWSQVLGSS